jgi:hypothetical protein
MGTPETSAVLNTQDTGRRQTIERHRQYIQYCRCLWIVCRRPVTCVSNTADVSGLFVLVLCLVCPILPMALDCLSSSCFLCFQYCRCLSEDKQSRDIASIGHTRHRTKTNNPETSAVLDTQDTGRRQAIQRHRPHWTVLYLVCPMLPISLNCLYSSCVLCVQCFRCLWIICLRPVSCVSNVADVSGLFVTIQRHRQHWTHKTQDEDKQSRDIGSIGHTRHRTKINNPETSATVDT